MIISEFLSHERIVKHSLAIPKIAMRPLIDIVTASLEDRSSLGGHIDDRTIFIVLIEQRFVFAKKTLVNVTICFHTIIISVFLMDRIGPFGSLFCSCEVLPASATIYNAKTACVVPARYHILQHIRPLFAKSNIRFDFDCLCRCAKVLHTIIISAFLLLVNSDRPRLGKIFLGRPF